MNKILVTGATGQIGSELTPALREKYGHDAVIASDIQQPEELDDPFVELDVTDREAIEEVVEEHDVDTIFHLAAILSAKGEENPGLAWDVNVNGLYNVFEVGREYDVEKIVTPSSIAVYGSTTPDNPSEETVLIPNTMYGISKVLTELLAEYYYENYDLDIRGVRLPGILSYKTLPGGGTTDYAVEVFYDAIEQGHYEYFVRPDTMLPMMYMPDAVNALMQLAEADDDGLNYRCAYNVSALTFTAAELTEAIKEHLPDFEATYAPDDRQAIADSWPDRVDDAAAREDWDWEPEYKLEDMVEDMLTNLEKKLSE
ncbi:MAG TPA: NAD-dependent epimerase/dehydratase family protein [Natrialbaceae archaeon]|nr:NAD-dependent epimerase/dehydratase family protein [Natrialbaceae archaeon]